jgi:threonine dehydrogenase-like Zn-dependent dehydrogenase
VLITHDLSLEEGVRAYDLLKNKQDGCIRVALRP